MIIADKIIMLRKKNGWSQEELAEQLDVSRQSVSKWESGLSVPDLNKVVAMSTLFGVSTDFLLKDDLEEISTSETQEQDDAVGRTISAEEANRYLDTNAVYARRIALGVALCILSPVLLILLVGMAAVWGIPETVATAVGMGVLLLLVACGVALFVLSGIGLSEFSYLEKETFLLAYGVSGIVEKRRDENSTRYRVCLTVGVVLCILSVIPLVVCGALGAGNSFLVGCTALLLSVCACGVALLVWGGCLDGGFQKLLQTGDYTETKKRRQRENEAISTGYWCLMTAVYLGASFFTGAWHITWVIWPVAGCVWAAIEALLGKDKE